MLPHRHCPPPTFGKGVEIRAEDFFTTSISPYVFYNNVFAKYFHGLAATISLS